MVAFQWKHEADEEDAMTALSEEALWFVLDQLAVRESAVGGNAAKSAAAESLMRLLRQPTPEQCRAWAR